LAEELTQHDKRQLADLAVEFVAVRDSLNPKGTVLGFTQDEWGTFVGGVRNAWAEFATASSTAAGSDCLD
jgi:hypothetical protein